MSKKGVNFSKFSKEYLDNKKDPNKKFWSDVSVALIIALAFFLLIFIVPRFFYEVVNIDGASMEPTVFADENKVGILKTNNVGYGDIVVIDVKYLGLMDDKGNIIDNIIKRVIGLEGDTIEIRKDGETYKVYRDNVALDEPYINGKMSGLYANIKYKVNKDHIFVLGDNRNISKDSRSNEIGQIPTAKILGKGITILTKTSTFLGINWYSTKFL